MLKKDVIGKASALSLSETFRCGECLHFKNKAHPSKDGACNTLGIKSVAIAPSCYTPDVTQVARNSDQFVQLAAIFNSYSYKERRIMLGVLRGATKKRKYEFGQKLYFKLGRDYLNNYVCGYVMGYTSHGELIVSGSPDRKTRGKSMLCYFTDSEGLMMPNEWKEKKKALIAAGKLEDPKQDKLPKVNLDSYEPPSIDSYDEARWKERAPKRKRVEAVDKSMTFNF